MTATSYVYGREIDGSHERWVILVAVPVRGGTLLHEEHTRSGPNNSRRMLLNRIVPLPAGTTVETWLQERDQELQASGWDPPNRVAGFC
ncbi:hypothetical protein FH608_023820 [Nonomuraea phyllanthi]|uniref:Uncharacterized protein n=1 Tax=Nonomuraea phyllanthi TaxID=2219224 RepID=A0A5C4W8X4_9ACTN|nr:hypothetical protein [Nonomuraea phyllanthi]KAB8192538.1 hypothetical protein FH608_023820 [Nonomuraea phyllanthi]QFY08015.1 hypothetical protein GBF35_16210 [Nonomuraea phyllanthi]